MKTVGSRASVIHGNAMKTSGGLTKSDLTRNKSGSIVSKKKSVGAGKKESPLLVEWRNSVTDAYKLPKYAGQFIPLKKGTPFYNDVKEIYAKRVEQFAKDCVKASK